MLLIYRLSKYCFACGILPASKRKMFRPVLCDEEFKGDDIKDLTRKSFEGCSKDFQSRYLVT
jgi:hypothetical protein